MIEEMSSNVVPSTSYGSWAEQNKLNTSEKTQKLSSISIPENQKLEENLILQAHS